MSYAREYSTRKALASNKEEAERLAKEAELQEEVFKALEEKAVNLFLTYFKKLVDGGVPPEEAAITSRVILFSKVTPNAPGVGGHY